MFYNISKYFITDLDFERQSISTDSKHSYIWPQKYNQIQEAKF